MTPQELKKKVIGQIDRYLDDYEFRESGASVGTHWSKGKIATELEEMRKHVVDPYVFEFCDYKTSLTTKPEVKKCWVVVDDGSYKMFVDNESGEFVLTEQGANGNWCSWGIRGDAVSTFLAR